MAAEKRVLGDEVALLTHSLEELRAQSAKREAEWAESKEAVRGALEGQVAEMQRQLSAVQDELSDARQAAKEKEEELTQLYKKGAVGSEGWPQVFLYTVAQTCVLAYVCVLYVP